MIEDPNRPAWAGNFFVGVPAPAGAITVLLPIYLSFLGLPQTIVVVWFTLFYTLAIGFLMVSRLPVFSGKQFGKKVAPELVLPVFVLVVLFIAILIAYPWPLLTIGALAYLASLPFGWMSYRDHDRKAAGASGAATQPPANADEAADVRPEGHASGTIEDDRPVRLN
jgi:CDP-diacylglycerol--serine O-phosphatidyltransferase